MTGTSTVNSRRLPASPSKRPITIIEIRDRERPEHCKCSGRSRSRFAKQLIMARHRLDRGNDFVVGHFLGGAGKGSIAPIHEDGPIAFGTATQSTDQLLPFAVIERSKIHRGSPFLI